MGMEGGPPQAKILSPEEAGNMSEQEIVDWLQPGREIVMKLSPDDEVVGQFRIESIDDDRKCLVVVGGSGRHTVAFKQVFSGLGKNPDAPLE